MRNVLSVTVVVLACAFAFPLSAAAEHEADKHYDPAFSVTKQTQNEQTLFPAQPQQGTSVRTDRYETVPVSELQPVHIVTIAGLFAVFFLITGFSLLFMSRKEADVAQR